MSSTAWDVDVSIATNAGLKLHSKNEMWRQIHDRRRKLSEKIESAHIVIDGDRWDFSRELTEGCVVFVADTDEETLNGLPISDGNGPNYTVKAPELIELAKPRLDLKTYLRAYRRPYGISSNAELQDALKEGDAPKRLIVAEGVNVTREMLDEGLRDGIIFSWAR